MRPTLLAAFLSIAGVFPSAAADSIFWKSVAGWDVYLDPSVGNGCYITTSYDGGTFLRLGLDFTAKSPSVYLALSNENWRSLEVGKEYSIEVQFDNNPVWTANAGVMLIGNYKYLTTTSTDTNFIREFSHKLRMSVRFGGHQVAALRLTGSAAATQELLTCQLAADARQAPSGKPADPFADPPATNASKDPFAL